VGTKITSLPYTISTPGFYYLSSNLTSSSSGINIKSSNVTVDLMGFKITGPGGLGYGISIYKDTASLENVEIRNGTINGFYTGIWSFATEKCRIINMRVFGNYMEGIYLNDSGHMIKGCTSSDNNSVGIFCRNSLVINNVAVTNNGGNLNATGTIVNNYAP
jgi:hypothetical protein